MTDTNWIVCKKNNRATFVLIFSTDSADRLSNTCFRGKDKALAGNFSKWSTFEEMITTPWIREELGAAIREMLNESEEHRTERFELEDYETVGWASTIQHSTINGTECEIFTPSKDSRAMKITDPKFPAPRTTIITFAVELRKRNNKQQVVIRTIYPGPDIGRLQGNITKNENVVFLDWNNPGDQHPVLTV